MSILSKQRPYLDSLGLPNDADMIRRVRAFSIQAGLTHVEMAELAGLNPNSYRVYIAGHYCRHNGAESNTLAVRAALKAAIDKFETHQPVQTHTHHSTAEYEAVRKSMWKALRDGTAFLVDGPPGTQKTYTFRRVAEEINASGEGRAVYVYARVSHAPAAFLTEACTEAGIPNRGNIDQLIRKLRYFLGSGRTLLIVDEGQHLGTPGLEVLRQLLDQPPYFGVALGGSHDLLRRVAKNWQMEQWRSRLRRTHMLTGLAAGEAERILLAELGAMSKQDLNETIADATAKAERDGKVYTYVSARNLFFAIQDARGMLSEQTAQKAEAVA